MKDYNILASPLTFLSILDVQMEEKIGEHGRLIIEGYIEDEKEEEFLSLLKGDIWEKVEKIGKNGEREILFWGIVTNFSISSQHHEKRMFLEITSGSCLMDQESHIRSYQDKEQTYRQIFNMIMGEYPESSIKINSSLEDVPEQLILQYYETDWCFLKRIASRKHQSLTACSRAKGIKTIYGLPEGQKIELKENGRYTVKKELDVYKRKKCNGLPGLKEDSSLVYIMESRENHCLGDYTSIFGITFYIYKIKSRYSGGEMLHNCYFKPVEGVEVPRIQNEKIAGNSLDAIVREVKEDKVQIEILADENKQQKINIWYPYATVYSTPDGTGWYCMPEQGDAVRLIFPSREEGEAFVSSSVHMETDSTDRKDPDIKTLKSKYQKEVRFTPESIIITNNQGTRIELTDAEGIRMVSAHSVILEAVEDMTVSSDTGSLIIAGASSVSFKQGGTGINLDKGISFIGGELRVQ